MGVRTVWSVVIQQDRAAEDCPSGSGPASRLHLQGGMHLARRARWDIEDPTPCPACSSNAFRGRRTAVQGLS